MQDLAERHFFKLVFGIWLFAALAMVSLSHGAISSWKMGDPDDQMRMLQVRDWLAGQSWWDITQYRMNAPYGGDMHWSRLVDVPLGLAIVMLRPLVGQVLAEQVVAALVPLLILAAVLYLYALAARRIFGALTAVVATGLVITIMPFLLQMAPMRIDHHGWQLLCFALALWALFDRKASLWSALILGLSCAMWIEISVEGLPFAALFLGVSALRWIFPGLAVASTRNNQFPVAMSAAALGAFLFFSVTESWSEPNHCDALSRVHVIALAVMATVIAAGALAARKWTALDTVCTRLGVCTMAGIAGILTMMALAPQCAGDAFAGLDPLVRVYWFDRTPEGLPLWAAPTDFAVPAYAYFLAGGVALLFVAVGHKHLPFSDKLRLGLLYVGTLFIGALVSRTAVYAMTIANLFLAAMLLELFMAAERRTGLTGRMGLRVIALLLALPSLSAQLVTDQLNAAEAKTSTATTASDDRFTAQVRACQKSSAAVSLGLLQPSAIMAGLDTNPAILQFTKHSVVASGHHRNEAAMADVIRTFTGKPDQAAEIIKSRHIRFVVICDGSYELALYARKAPDGLLAQLRAGDVPAWLRRQPDIGPFQIYEVAPSLLPQGKLS
ncbi:hypothetical protein [Sphingorhabdus sp.]|uniref:hypothetical protein n=1 Tax=Sphingorhabdus sp. TaxID=1902408 RepID=UPI00391D3A49